MVVLPSDMRGLNRRALFGCLRRLGVASRADLAKSLGMSAPTAGKIVAELLELGLLEETQEPLAASLPGTSGRTRPHHRRRLGRPGRLLRLDRHRARFLAVELGVSHTRLAVVPIGAGESTDWAQHFPTGRSAAGWQAQLARAAALLPVHRLWGILVSVPGIVDEAAARVLFSPNLHWSAEVDLRALLREVWDLPVELVQEERALALGQLAADPAGEDFFLVDFGEGVGGAVVTGGRVYQSPLPLSGELGHTPVLGNHRACGCGAIGCVETLISCQGLLESYAAAHRNGPPTWDGLRQHLADRGVPAWLTATLDAIGAGIAGALNVLGLRRAIITGSLTELPATVLDHLAAAVAKGAMWARFGQVVCQGAPRRRIAGLITVGIERVVMSAAAATPGEARSPTRVTHL